MWKSGGVIDHPYSVRLVFCHSKEDKKFGQEYTQGDERLVELTFAKGRKSAGHFLYKKDNKHTRRRKVWRVGGASGKKKKDLAHEGTVTLKKKKYKKVEGRGGAY